MFDQNNTPDTYEEARRQLQICNACRYCEGYCSAFPAITRLREFSDDDITQISNLCHNCQGCYYACQYTEPHEFALNLPAALAEVRTQSWEDYAWPAPLAKAFLHNAWATVAVLLIGFVVLFGAMRLLPPASGDGFYAVLSHGVMVAIFAPVFLLPLAAMGFGLRRYWRDVGGQRLSMAHMQDALAQVAAMKNLAGGHGEGCNFEKEDRFSQARRLAHQFIMYGFLLCFASTSSGTVMHYLFGLHAPYGPFSLPKLLGVPGGILLGAGCLWMLWLKSQSDPALSNKSARASETAFVALLGFVAISGLALYWLADTSIMPSILALHLGAVFSFFILTPYTKMAHGFFRLAALLRDAQARKG